MWIRDGLPDLTYCTNIHPGESWHEVFCNVAAYGPALKDRLSPGAPFGLGLRLSAAAAQQLRSGSLLEEFNTFLQQNGLYVALLNGFPFGSFHRGAIKSKAFAPDWRTEERLHYTLNLIAILQELLPEGMEGGISTVPLSYKPWIGRFDGPGWLQIIRNLARIAEALVCIRRDTGRLIHLDLEPEPDGLLENTRELIEFFQGPLSKTAARMLARSLGIGLEEARQCLFDHIRVCFDTCHMVVEYEQTAESLRLMAKEGIGVGRIQVSSALQVAFGAWTELREQLATLANSNYLHQVIEQRNDGALRHYRDLPEALAIGDDPGRKEWRIHYHVPLFTAAYGALRSTQDEIKDALQAARELGLTRHLEIETYTWDVLPGPLKLDLLTSIEREYVWVLNELCGKPLS